jgi:hypothetical protein
MPCCIAPQNDCLNHTFVKYTDVIGKKMARNCRKTAIYEVANFGYQSLGYDSLKWF